jgi:hypothetical protein
MSLVNVVLWLIGVALVVIGYTRARVPWARYQALKEEQANVARYEAWRGGLRTQDDERTGASVAMAALRRQAQAAGLIAIVGFLLIFLGFWLS